MKMHRYVVSAILSGAVLIGRFSSTTHASVILSNATTQVTVFGGESNNGLVPVGGFHDYIDLTSGVSTAWSIDPVLIVDGIPSVLSNGATGGFGSPVDLGGGLVENTAAFGNISVRAVTELIGSAARTTFTFEKIDLNGSDLDGSTFVFYAENDIFSASDDTALFTGSIATDDLALFQFDSVAGGLTVKLTAKNLGGAPLSLFGAGLWTGFGAAIESADLSVLSTDGSNFSTVGDLGIALAFSLSGSSGVVQVDYDTQPETPIVPEPASLSLFAIGLVALATRRGLGR